MALDNPSAPRIREVLAARARRACDLGQTPHIERLLTDLIDALDAERARADAERARADEAEARLSAAAGIFREATALTEERFGCHE